MWPPMLKFNGGDPLSYKEIKPLPCFFTRWEALGKGGERERGAKRRQVQVSQKSCLDIFMCSMQYVLLLLGLPKPKRVGCWQLKVCVRGVFNTKTLNQVLFYFDIKKNLRNFLNKMFFLTIYFNYFYLFLQMGIKNNCTKIIFNL